MELQEDKSSDKNGQTSSPDPKTALENPHNGKTLESQYFTEDFDSTCSTPYVSAPSSPGRPGSGPVNGGFFYSCPASPMHFAITSSAAERRSFASTPDRSVPIGYEFEFSARFGSTGSGQTGSMSSADELFLNGQIRPMKLSSHLERPQVLAPLLDLENEEEDGDSGNDDELMNGSRKGSDNGESMSRGRDLRLKNKSLRRRTRSMSPLRSTSFENYDEESKNVTEGSSTSLEVNDESLKLDEATTSGGANTPSVSASSSRSSSAGRNSKRWVFLKDFLYRSKSEGRSNNKFWSNISFSPAKEKSKQLSGGVQLGMSKEKSSGSSNNNGTVAGGESKRRVPISPHELHYKASRAQAEEMRKKTFLPYRQGLLGCLGFSSKGYGAMNGIARALNPAGGGVDNTFRRKFDPEEYLERAREREKQEAEGRGKSKCFEMVVTPIAPLSQQAGYYCSVCECVVKDSANYLDHINGKKHQRALGMSMRVERASLQQVQERFEKLKKRREPGSFTEQEKAAEEEEPDIDPDIAAMMGFGGFGLDI
ncbi:hypothetical protein SADUNF_Sadunf13G0008700 [Salix dunnii]|uniref:U1-type domain-containing protein n=1 Tax=Salix dunnii TaxID=1413687 RepID=A0A835JK07_9ROSI|nr:hypothetical protein SADUNF_Sadunf13G0008700 [Salix dunnii]